MKQNTDTEYSIYLHVTPRGSKISEEIQDICSNKRKREGRKKQEDYKFKTSLVCIVSSRPARTEDSRLGIHLNGKVLA